MGRDRAVAREETICGQVVVVEVEEVGRMVGWSGASCGSVLLTMAMFGIDMFAVQEPSINCNHHPSAQSLSVTLHAHHRNHRRSPLHALSPLSSPPITTTHTTTVHHPSHRTVGLDDDLLRAWDGTTAAASPALRPLLSQG